MSTSREELYRIALSEILASVHETLEAEGITGWGEGRRLGDTLLGIKDCAVSVLQHGIAADSSRLRYDQQREEPVDDGT